MDREILVKQANGTWKKIPAKDWQYAQPETRPQPRETTPNYAGVDPYIAADLYAEDQAWNFSW